MREIQLSHGGGGVEMNQLINQLFFRHFGNEILLRGEDAALLPVEGPVAFTTDSFTVSPLFFEGGDIGKLAIAGTVNDLAMMGAKPEYLSASFIIEEGFPYADLARIVESMAAELAKSGARIVCGDTKVVPKGAADKIFINTSGVGTFPLPEQSRGISVRNLKAGDAILVSRDIGSHGACILMARDALQLGSDLKSDCTTLWPQVEALLQVVQQRLVVAGAFLAAQVPAVAVGAGLLGTEELAGDVGGGCVGHGLIDRTLARERRGCKWVRGRAWGERNLARRERGHGHS